MRLRLYHRPRSRSTRVLWALEEAGLPYELELVDRERASSEEHRERHPLGRVPVLEQDGRCLFESGGLCLYVAELAPQAGLIAPAGTLERALTYQWAFFCISEVEPPLVAVMLARERDPARAAEARERARRACEVLERQLAQRDWLVGARFGVADILACSVLVFARALGLLDGLDAAVAYVERLLARPAAQRAYASAA